MPKSSKNATMPKWPRYARNRLVLAGDVVRFGGDLMTVGRVSFGIEGSTVVLTSPSNVEACITDPGVLRSSVELVSRDPCCASCANRDVLVRDDSVASVCKKRGVLLHGKATRRRAPCAVREWGLTDYVPLPEGDLRELLPPA